LRLARGRGAGLYLTHTTHIATPDRSRMDNRSLGLVVVALGAVVVAGLLIMAGGLGWFGRLPGDVRVQSGGVRVYFPIVSMLLVSVVLSLLVALVRRFL
jgi:hypothetical protein